MGILGIETATAVCAAAVVQGSRVLAEELVEERYVHAEQLLPHIDAVLRRTGRSVSDLDAFAVSIGPGSFTGLRIGLSVTKGLAAVSGKPIVAVPTLTALAGRVVDPRPGDSGAAKNILAAIDARRDEVYCQLFEVRDGSVIPVWEPRDMTVTELIRILGTSPVIVTGDGRSKVLAAAREADAERATMLIPAHPDQAGCSAGAVALIGERMLAEGAIADTALLEPMYIKEFFLVRRKK